MLSTLVIFILIFTVGPSVLSNFTKRNSLRESEKFDQDWYNNMNN